MIGDIRSFDLHRVNNAGSGSHRLPSRGIPNTPVKAPGTGEAPTRMLDRHGFKPEMSKVIKPSLLKARWPHAAPI